MDFLRLFLQGRLLGWLPSLYISGSIGWEFGGVVGYPLRDRVRNIGHYQLTGLLWGVFGFLIVVGAAWVRHGTFSYPAFGMLAPVRGIPWLSGRANLWRLHRDHRGRASALAAWEAKRRGDIFGLVVVGIGMALAQWPALRPVLAVGALGAMAGLALVAAGERTIVRGVAHLRDLFTIGHGPRGGHAIGPRRLIFVGLQTGAAVGMFAGLAGWDLGGWTVYAPILAGFASLAIFLWWRPELRRILLKATRTHAPNKRSIVAARRAARRALRVTLEVQALAGLVVVLVQWARLR